MVKNNPRNADFHVRMTREERDEFDRIAAACGLSRSQLVRLLAQLPISEMHAGNIHLVTVDDKELARIHREMRRFGTNMNQAAHALNSIAYYQRCGSLRYELVETAVPDIQRRLDEVGAAQADIARKIDDLEDAHLVRSS